MNDQIFLSVHKSITTKPKRLNGQSWSRDWTARNLFFDQFLNLAKAGKSFAVAQFEDNHRRTANFIRSNIIGIDVDSLIGNQPILDTHMSIYLSDSFIQDNAMLIAETSSSKPDARRFRVWFWLDEVITDPDEYKQLTTVIQNLVPYCDQSTKDAARGYFGTVGEPLLAQYVQVKTATLRAKLTSSTEKAPRRAADLRRSERGQRSNNPTDTDINEVRAALARIPADTIEYQTWVSVLFSLKSLGDSEAIRLAEEWSGFCSQPDEIRFKIETATHAMGIGYLFEVAKGYGYRAARNDSGSSRRQKSPPRNQVKRVNMRFVGRQNIDLKGTWAIKSAIGTGKTELLTEIMHRHESILVVSHRVALIDQMADRFYKAGLNFEHYRQLPKEDLRLAKRLIITPNSLYKLMLNSDTAPRYDLVIVDESEAVLEHMLGDTFRQREGLIAHSLFAEIVGLSENVIFADANLSELSLNWLKKHRREPVNQFVNEYHMQRGKMVVYERREATVKALLTSLRRSIEPIAIATDSKEEALRLHRLLSGSKFSGRVISSNNSQNKDVQEFLKDINSEIMTLDYLIYTPSVGVGVDIQAPIKKVFGFFSNRSITAYDQMQALGRCRKASQFFIYSAPMSNFGETEPKKIIANILTNVAEHARRYGFSFQWDNGRIKPSDIQHDYLELFAEVEAHRNKLMRDSQASFITEAKREYSVKLDGRGKDKKLKKQLKAIKKAEREYWRGLTLTSTPRDADYYAEAQLAGDMTDETIAGYRRWQIESFFNYTISEELFEFTAQGGISQTKIFIMLHRPAEDILKIDARQYDEDIPLHKRKLYAQKMAVMRALIRTVMPNGFHFFELSEEDWRKVLEKFQDKWQRLNADQVFGRRAHHSTDAIARFRWLLKQAGLQFKTVYRTRDKLKHFYLCFESYSQMVVWASIRLTAKGENGMKLFAVPVSDELYKVLDCQFPSPEPRTGNLADVVSQAERFVESLPPYLDKEGLFWDVA